jgi:Tol biopolymer transport system component
MKKYPFFGLIQIIIVIFILVLFVRMASSMELLRDNEFAQNALKQSWHIMIYNTDSEKIELLFPQKWGFFFKYKPKYSFSESVWVTDPTISTNETVMFAKSNGVHQGLEMSFDGIHSIFTKNIFNGIYSKLLENEGKIFSPVMSWDRNYIVYIGRDTNNKEYLWLYDIVRHNKRIIDGNIEPYCTGYGISMSWSPDSKNIFFSTTNGKIYCYNIYDTRLTEICNGYSPICSPTGEYFIFRTDVYTPYIYNLYDIRHKTITDHKFPDNYNVAWSPDGKYIIAVKFDLAIIDTIKFLFVGERIRKSIVLIDVTTNQEKVIYHYYGHNDLDCKVVKLNPSKAFRGTLR